MMTSLCNLHKFIYFMQSKEPNETGSPFYAYLPRAKTLQERQQAKLLSLFQLIPLPQYLDSNEIYSQPFAQISKSTDSNNKLHTAPSTKFCQVFSQPIFKSNPKLLISQNNQVFGQLKAKGKDLLPKEHLIDSTEPKSEDLEFQSRFQCGNLALASKVSQSQYNLLIQKDINTNSCTQWFFFRVRNNKTIGRIKFNMLNLTKSYSAFENGMQVCVFSRAQYERTGKGWHRSCTDIEYCRNNIARSKERSYYTLSFVFDFTEQYNEVYFAYCYPYTYSRLQRYVAKLEQKHPKMVYRRRIGQSLSGNFIEMLTITNFGGDTKKPVIFISARVHPGETVSSYVCQGFLDFLVGHSKQAAMLRDQFVFKIIPMLNPDGVINGNYRCSLIGKDLNRVWQAPDKTLHPQVCSAKKMINDAVGQRMAYIDLHGHSKKRSVFVYGCKNRANPFECRELPFLLHKKLKNFNYYYCNFSTPRVREGTARVAIWKEFNINHCYTLQSSFFGPLKEKRHFTSKEYYNVGVDLAKVVSLYFCRKRPTNNSPKQQQSSNSQELKQIFEELYSNTQLLTIGDDVSEGSSSAESLDQPPQRFLSPGRQKARAQMNQTTYLPAKKTFMVTKESVDEKPLPDVFRSKKNPKVSQIQAFQTSISFNLGKTEMRSPKSSLPRVPPILDIKVEHSPYQSLPKVPRPAINKVLAHRNSDLVPQIHLVHQQQRASSNYIQRSFEMTSIVFPASLKSEYTNYQRYRKEELDLNVLLFGDRRVPHKEVYVAQKSISERVNKKEIQSVQKRVPRDLRSKIRRAL